MEKEALDRASFPLQLNSAVAADGGASATQFELIFEFYEMFKRLGVV